MFENTITIFNVLSSGYSKVMYPKAIENVELQIHSEVRASESGLKFADTANLFIMFRDDYLSPEQWKSSENKEDFFTLKKGDVFVKGSHILQDMDINTLNEHFENVYEIKSVSELNSSDSFSHWEVCGA